MSGGNDMVIVGLLERKKNVPTHHFSFDDNFIMVNALTLLISIKRAKVDETALLL